MTLLALVGPTASGKSAVALAVAERAPIEIVSMDSVQVYRGLDIGSAKPTPDERARVPHHLVDLVEPDARFSTADWLRACDAAIASIRARGKIPLVVGGTGLYWRALTDGLAELPSADDALRKQLAAEEASSPGALHARLALVDPVTARRLAPRDLVRVVRALEVHALSGVPLSQHHEMQASSRPRFQTLAIVLPDAELRAAIEARVTRMLDAGLVEEARALKARHGAVRPLEAVGYRQALDDTLEPAALQPAIATATWQFARRQRTWFRRAGARSPADALAKLFELLDGAR